MFKKNKSQNRIDSLIGAGSTVHGDISFAGGLRIDGAIVGNVLGLDDGTLVVSEKAQIKGRVQCARLILNGEIAGPIEASQYVELQPKARVKGDLAYQTLEMHPGAVVEGRLLHVIAGGLREEVTEQEAV